MAWIFEKIEDLRRDVLKYDVKNISAYNAALRKHVEPKTYVLYIFNTFDVYVDVTMITVCALNVYPDLDATTVEQWCQEQIKKEKGKYLVY